jgi:flagellar L-ring protein precursor FlgH
MKYSILLLLLVIVLGGCAPKEPPPVVIHEPLEEIYEAKEVVKEAGSLWNQSNGSMFTDQKAQNVGDIVTVLISESSSASKAATTSTSRDTSMSASIPNFFGLKTTKTGMVITLTIIPNTYRPISLMALTETALPVEQRTLPPP